MKQYIEYLNVGYLNESTYKGAFDNSFYNNVGYLQIHKTQYDNLDDETKKMYDTISYKMKIGNKEFTPEEEAFINANRYQPPPKIDIGYPDTKDKLNKAIDKVKNRFKRKKKPEQSLQNDGDDELPFDITTKDDEGEFQFQF